MKRTTFASLLTVALFCSAALAQEAAKPATLKPGDPAPKLQVSKWVKGEPVKEFEKGKIYVVEFWATWCGPCRASIPHVSSLQAKHKEITVIGQNVWEQDESQVAPFVEQMGAKMAYRVAMDDKSASQKGAMAETWMEAAGQNGIPCAFIIDKEGQVAWIGHPMEMDKPLEQVLAGTFDVKAAAAAQVKAQEARVAQQKLFEKIGPAAQAKDWDTVLAALDEAQKAGGPAAEIALNLKFQVLLEKKDYTAAYAMGDQFYEAIKDMAPALNAVAWRLVADPGIEKRNLDLAEKMAKRSVELTESKDAAVLDTLARIYFDKGEVDKAIETETKAVSLAPEELKAKLSENLKKYEEKKGTK